MNPSPPSNSDDAAASAWASLHPKVQHWIWKQEWKELRDVQARAVAPILAGRDVILAAPTAGGKTEAAFLPIASALADDPAGSFRALYIGPLKALINDQCDRLDSLCGAAGIDVHKRHGDASVLKKAAALKNPTGVLLTTPESLEALFVIHGSRLAVYFAKLAYVVVDELHAFIGDERGRQVQTQLHRLELILRRRVPRVGLSATLGDMALAAEALRPGAGDGVEVIQAKSDGAEVRILIRGVVKPLSPSVGKSESEADAPEPTEPTEPPEPPDPPEPMGELQEVADDLFRRLRGADNLVFANSRARIERLADLLRTASEKAGVRNEFLPHHGGLAKELRQDVERDLKSKHVHLTAVCTSTLEMGIDIGAVESVAQVGPPPSVASLKQRIGRSGRRAGQPQVLRGYSLEDECDSKSALRTALRLNTVQFCAMTDLMLTRWTEPPRAGVLHLSTLVQQTLSVLAQTGGARADVLWRALCDTGPFREVSAADYGEFLRSLAAFELIQQLHDDSLFLDLKGERMVEHFDFYAAFQAIDEWRLVADGRAIGTTSISTPMMVGEHLLFAGRRWQIEIGRAHV